MRTPALLFALLALTSSAAGPSPQPTTAAQLRAVQYTEADLQLYVDPLGSDTGTCTSTGAGACLTIPGAINKIPKVLRHRGRVTVAAGSFAGFAVSGFSSDFGIQRTTGGLLIEGTLAASTGLASGSATGTATGGTAGTDATHGTLVDGAATWTVDNLRGRFIEIVSGTGVGQLRVIASNTANTITIAGLWTAPTAGSVYAIRDSTTAITSCITGPPSATETVSTAGAAVRVQGNAAGTTITIRGFSVSAACNFGVYQSDVATLAVYRLQFTSTAGTASRLSLAGPFFVSDVASTYPSTAGSHLTGPSLSAFNLTAAGGLGNLPGVAIGSGTLQNSLFVAGSQGANLGTFALRPSLVTGMRMVDIAGTGVSLGGNMSSMTSMNIDCTAAAGAVGVLVSQLSTQGQTPLNHMNVTDCFTAVRLQGPSAFLLSMQSLTVTNVTNILDVRHGATLTLFSSPTGGALGSEVILDNDATMTSTFAAIATGGSFTNLATGSRVRKD